MLCDQTVSRELRAGDARLELAAPCALVGSSRQSRSIYCVMRGRSSAPLRVLVLAGQHGDEWPARRAVNALLARPPQEVSARLPNSLLAVIPEANPDGCATSCRHNAEGIDLNRDHQRLASPETAAIHQFVRRWQPRVILDLHSYPSRRLHLLARNIVLDHDVFLDVATHPAILARPDHVNAVEILRQLLQSLNGQDVRAGRYTIVAPSGRARHSTSDVVDARNGLALRYGVFTILVENRQPRAGEAAADRLHLRAAQERALWSVLEWLDRNGGLLPASWLTSRPATGALVPVRFKYADEGHHLQMLCRDAGNGRLTRVIFPRYSSGVEARRAVALPPAYAVPREFTALRSVLRRHGFLSRPHAPGSSSQVERLRIERARPPRRQGRPARKIQLVPHRVRMSLDHYEVFPTQQTCGDALVVYLEPESKYGLHRFAELGFSIRSPSWYPVLRVLEGQGQDSCLSS